ncbi:hypothetical protein BCR34DRAFT_499683 [Clohesyomyces aquaticus]|uniref:Heterokaryon incompatibility domain-containing protein n=1 Tax=Clohesyomyces aquaticus TaxID=1231657 RepID=A0A1Y1Y704_9PLEO|nr:hypothetical protein BCR34DRAFT_499683 [Clohesyomyces aquaticus]
MNTIRLLLTVIDNPAAAYITTPSSNLDVSSERAFEFAKQCLKKCNESHTGCQPLTPLNKPPHRLIDFGDDSEQPKLIETRGTMSFEYAALSYCWGGDQDYKLTTSNVVGCQQELRIPSTAKTIHDAILTTKRLGLRYLWLDALCIMQNSCFLKPRKPLRLMRRLPFLCPKGELGSILLHHEDPRTGGPYPIETRAWTLQEDILSTQILKFGNEVLWWSCGCNIKSKTGK